MKKMIEKRRGTRRQQTRALPDISLMNGVVAPEVLSAMKAADRILTKAGIPHALVGGLAVGAYGHPRATRDADFLVGDSAFIRRRGVLTMRPEIPVDVRGVAIDTLWANSAEESLGIGLAAQGGEGVLIVPVEVLVTMKLRARRSQDDADVVGLLRGGADEDAIRSVVHRFDPGLVGRFDQLAKQANTEGRRR